MTSSRCHQPDRCGERVHRLLCSFGLLGLFGLSCLSQFVPCVQFSLVRGTKPARRIN